MDCPHVADRSAGVSVRVRHSHGTGVTLCRRLRRRHNVNPVPCACGARGGGEDCDTRGVVRTQHAGGGAHCVLSVHRRRGGGGDISARSPARQT